jgi:hypothetical protein
LIPDGRIRTLADSRVRAPHPGVAQVHAGLVLTVEWHRFGQNTHTVSDCARRVEMIAKHIAHDSLSFCDTTPHRVEGTL